MKPTNRAAAVRHLQPGMSNMKATVLWFVAGLFVLALSVLASGDARAQMTPAGQSIGNQASATYVDVTNLAQTLTSTSNVVTTVVSQVYNFTLAAPGAQTRPANQQVCYPHTITNTGNGADVFTLTAPVGATVTGPTPFYQGGTLAYYPDVSPNDGAPDVGPAITVTPTLNAGQSYTFVVCGTTSASAVAGNSGTITIAATSTGTVSPPVAAIVDTTTIGNCSITLNKTLSSTPPPGLTPVTGGVAPLTNVVGNPGLYVVLAYSNGGTLACNNVIIQDSLQSGFLYRTGSGRWSNSGATVLTDAAGGDTGINYTAPTTDLTAGIVSATIPSIAGGTSGNVYFQVSIAANLPVGVTAATTNTANVTFTDALTMVTAGPNNSNTITYNVQQVAAVEFNGSATSSVAAAGEGSGTTIVASASPGQTIQWTDVVWNKGNATDTFDIRFVDGLGAVVGNSASFTGANCTGGAGASPICTFPANTTFTVFRTDGTTTLLDTSGNTTPDTGPIPLPTGGNCPVGFVGNAGAGLATACGYQIVVKATIPAGATPGGGPYRIVLQARSVFDTAVVDTVPNVLTTITANSVDLTNNAALPGGLGSGAGTASIIVTNNVTPLVSAPQTTRFVLVVNNTSPIATVYDLSGTFVAVPTGVGLAAQPVNWVIQFRQDGGAGNCTTVGSVITSTGAVPVPALGSQLVCGEVVIPATNQGNGGSRPTDSPPGNYDVQFRAQQQGNAAVADTIVDRVVLATANSVTITPNGTQQTSPGGAVTYQHTMTNSGNVAETISFPVGFLVNSQGGGWTAAAYVDDGGVPLAPVTDGVLTVGSDTTLTTTITFTMAPNTTRTLFVRVNAPAAAGSPPNVTTLTATYNAGGSNVSATDTTTLTSGLRLDKYQQLTACGASPAAASFTGLTANSPWVSSALPSGAGTAPGQCIAYLVVGTNTTSNNISNITISDVVPTFTTYQTACSPTAPAGTTGPLTISSVPANNAVGTIAAVSAPAPGGTPTPGSTLLPGGRVTLQFCVKIN